MQIQSYIHGRRLDLILTGKMDALDIAEADKTLEAVVSPTVCVAVVDLSGVDYISSAGLRLLLNLFKKLQYVGGTMALAGTKAYCCKIIEMAGFGGVFPMFAQVVEATAFCDQFLEKLGNTER
ncbi:MAG: STAS domain-containing protein [Kiritimatiellae bacterium]|nr:STAS domain-containing protein [Kiritimatiellia bacterium]